MESLLTGLNLADSDLIKTVCSYARRICFTCVITVAMWTMPAMCLRAITELDSDYPLEATENLIFFFKNYDSCFTSIICRLKWIEFSNSLSVT